jgi:hypothetical protein
MLLFKSEHVPMILSGRKCVTRRAWKKKRVLVGRIHQAKTGFSRADHFADIRIKAVYQERLGDISDQHVQWEGYDSRADYFAALARINKRPVSENEVFWVVEFELYRVVNNGR